MKSLSCCTILTLLILFSNITVVSAMEFIYRGKYYEVPDNYTKEQIKEYLSNVEARPTYDRVINNISNIPGSALNLVGNVMQGVTQIAKDSINSVTYVYPL